MATKIARRQVLAGMGSVAAACGALGLAACGGALNRGTSPAGSGAGGTPVTVAMWHIWDGNRTTPFHRSLAMLTEKKPNVRVDPTPMAQGTDREKEQKITAAIAAGDPPDLLMVNQGVFADLAGGGALVPLDDSLKTEKLSPNEWYEGAYRSGVWNGKLHGLPAVNSGPRLVYFNKAVLREAGLDPSKPPQTWEEIQRASQRVVKHEGDNLGRIGWSPGAGSFEWLIFSANGRTFSPDARMVAFGGSEGQQTIEYITDFAWSVYGGPAKLADFSRAYGGTFAQGPFVNAREAFTVNGPFLIPQIKDFAPQLDYGVSPVPHALRGKFADPMWVNWVYAIPTATRKRAQAWAVAEWVGHNEGHRWFMLDQQRPGVIKKYNDDPQYPRINPHWKTINEILDKYTVADQVVPGRGLAIAAMNRNLSQVYNRQVSARDGLANAVREAQQELDQAWARVRAGK